MTPEEIIKGEYPPKKIRVGDRHSYGLEFLPMESMQPFQNKKTLIGGLTPFYELDWHGEKHLYSYCREDRHFHYVDVRVKK